MPCEKCSDNGVIRLPNGKYVPCVECLGLTGAKLEERLQLQNMVTYINRVDPEPALTLRLHESQRALILAACRYFCTLFSCGADVPVEHIAALECLVDDLQKLEPEMKF